MIVVKISVGEFGKEKHKNTSPERYMKKELKVFNFTSLACVHFLIEEMVDEQKFYT